MKNTTAEQWLARRMQRLESDALSIAPEFFPEHIHQFRIEAKMLRAVLRFLAGNRDYKLPRQFRKRYAEAGGIRDRQVQLQTLTTVKEHRLPTFAVWLAYRVAGASKAWKRGKVDAAIRALQQPVQQYGTATVSEAHLWKYYRAYTHWLQEAVGENTSDDRLHEIRKHTKDMQYVFAFCRKVLPDAHEELAIAAHQLQKLGDIAGAYNDNTNLLLAAQGYRQDYGKFLCAEESAAIASAVTGWTAQKTALKQTLLQTADELIHVKAVPDVNADAA